MQSSVLRENITMKTAWVTVAVPCTVTEFRRRLDLERDLEVERERIRGVDSLKSGNPVDDMACPIAASSSLSSSSSSRSSPA